MNKINPNFLSSSAGGNGTPGDWLFSLFGDPTSFWLFSSNHPTGLFMILTQTT
jgi:hypothetical protein